MASFTPSNTGARFTDSDGEVSFTASSPRVSFTAGYQSVTGGGAVDSVNGDTGVVVLTAADVGAADENLTPRSVTLGLAVSAVDGTATVFDVIQPDPAATGSGDVPAGWTSVATIPNLATMQGLLTSNYPSGVNVLVPAGANAGVYFITAANVAGAWPELEVGVGAWLLGPWVPPGATYPWIGYRASATLFTQPASGNISHSPQGLDEGLTNVETILENHEGVMDTEHWVGAYFDTTVIDPTDYATAPVSQPTPDGGIIVVNTDVLVLTAVDTTKRGIWHIDADDGTWSQITYPDILIGNSFTVMVNAEGDADDGVHFEWLDEDPTVYKRRSYAYPGSSATYSDGRNGRWIKYTPGGSSTVDVVSNVATARILGRTSSGTGDSEELTAAQVRSLLGDPWVTITDTTLGSDTASFDVDTTGYNDIEVVLTGRGASTAGSTVGVRVRFNNDSGSNYLSNTSAASTAWNGVGTMPASQTNTDRNGVWTATISLGHTSTETTAVCVGTHRTSTSSTGTVPQTLAGYYTNLAAAITSMQLYPSGGDWAAGTRLLVRGRV